jgi:hypothetical protein
VVKGLDTCFRSLLSVLFPIDYLVAVPKRFCSVASVCSFAASDGLV